MDETRKHCAECRNAVEEDWPGNRAALRCAAEGERKGRVTVIYPEGRKTVVSGIEAPKWCKGYSIKEV